MSDDCYRQACLHGILVILVGLLVAGFPLVWVVTRDVYHQPIPFDPGGDYRGWLMAHLEGLLNGLLVIAIAAACRARPMGRVNQRILLTSLLLMAWGNLVASIAAPIYHVRAMTFDGHLANDVLVTIFTAALLATLVAFFVAIRHLTRRTREHVT